MRFTSSSGPEFFQLFVRTKIPKDTIFALWPNKLKLIGRKDQWNDFLGWNITVTVQWPYHIWRTGNKRKVKRINKNKRGTALLRKNQQKSFLRKSRTSFSQSFWGCIAKRLKGSSWKLGSLRNTGRDMPHFSSGKIFVAFLSSMSLWWILTSITLTSL